MCAVVLRPIGWSTDPAATSIALPSLARQNSFDPHWPQKPRLASADEAYQRRCSSPSSR